MEEASTGLSWGKLFVIVMLAAVATGLSRYVIPLLASITGGNGILLSGVVALAVGAGIMNYLRPGSPSEYATGAAAGLTGIAVVAAIGKVYTLMLQRVFAAADIVQGNTGGAADLLFAVEYGFFLVPFIYVYINDGGSVNRALWWLAAPAIGYLLIGAAGKFLLL